MAWNARFRCLPRAWRWAGLSNRRLPTSRVHGYYEKWRDKAELDKLIELGRLRHPDRLRQSTTGGFGMLLQCATDSASPGSATTAQPSAATCGWRCTRLGLGSGLACAVQIGAAHRELHPTNRCNALRHDARDPLSRPCARDSNFSP